MRHVLVTRGGHLAELTANIFSYLGLLPFILPMTRQVPMDGVNVSGSYDYIILTSPFAAGALASHEARGEKYIAVGEATAEAIALFLGADKDVLLPPESYGEAVPKIFAEVPLKGARVLYAGADKRLSSYGEFFEERGAVYEEAALYKTCPVIYKEGEVESFLKENSIEALTFFAPSGAKAFLSQIDPSKVRLPIVCIGKSTRKVFLEAGISAELSPVQTAKGVGEYIKSSLQFTIYNL